jgi:3-oxoadipate enol-lactonase
MAHAAASDGTRLWYEVFGNPRGEPLLLIQGLGADARGWTLQRRALGRDFRCIAFDNRGAGRSDKPAGPYSLEQMAADAVAVLDEVGVDSAHVVGASMGGVIAQILGVRHAARVRSLVLACTACSHLPWRRELLEEWAQVAREHGMAAMSRRSLRWLVGPRSHRRLYLPANLFASFLMRVPPAAFAAQVRAILDMDDAMADELQAIAVPVLVITGSQDILTPVADAEELADRIKAAELAILPGAAHALMAEQAGAFNHEVVDFLDRASLSRQEDARLPGALPLAGA